MAKTMPWGETIKVDVDAGFIVNAFTFGTSQFGGVDVLTGLTEFRDVTEYVTSVSISRGRSDQLSTFSPGVCTVVIDDRASGRQFDPANTASPLFEGDLGIAPRRFMRVYGGSAGTEPLWYGRINDLDIDYEQPDISIATISGVDDLADFGKTSLIAFIPTQTSPAGRINEILNRTEVAYSTATRSISTATTAVLGTVAYADNDNVKSALDNVAIAEDGRFFVSKDPTIGVVFQPRITFTTQPAVEFFSDLSGTAIPYQSLITGYGAETLINRAQVTLDSGGTAQTATDGTSISLYGVSTYALSGVPLANAAQASALAANIVDKYKDPISRFSEISVLFNGLTVDKQQSLAELEIGDPIEVSKTFTTGSPSTVIQEVYVERIQHQITPQIHRVILGLGQAQLVTNFILDSSELDDTEFVLG